MSVKFHIYKYSPIGGDKLMNWSRLR